MGTERKAEMWRKLLGKMKPRPSGASKLVKKYLLQVEKLKGVNCHLKSESVPTWSEIETFSRREMAEVAMAALVSSGSGPAQDIALHRLRDWLLRRKLPFNSEEIDQICKLIDSESWYYLQVSGSLLTVVERFEADHELSERACEMLNRAVDKTHASNAEQRKFAARLRKIVGIDNEPQIFAGEAWSDAAIDELDKIRGKKKLAAWNELLAHCQDSEGSKPKKIWAKTATQLLTQIGAQAFAERVSRWFLLVDRPDTQPTAPPVNEQMLDPANAMILKGLVWCSSLCQAPELTRALAPLAISAYKKVPGVGPRAVSLGNACMYALDEEKVEQITAWRNWLTEHEVRQPFKQAHREVYILTDAERNTQVYSNRFAAHVLKQHQFNALCAARNWKNKLRLTQVRQLTT
jgi:hypothetical protein